MLQFSELGLDERILKAVAEQGYTTPSPIQASAIPAVLSGRDIMAAAQTGTGKTAGFTLPILQLLAQGPKVGANQARALILTPTRELAAQVAENVEEYGRYLSLTSTVVFGGVKINPQMLRLRRGADILVATPGRLLDLISQNAVKLNALEVLVLDEADRMLDMGFINDIRKIIALLPRNRQTLMFSATFSDEIRELAKRLVKDPVEISVTPKNSAAVSVKQWLHPVDKAQKTDLLIELIKTQNWSQALVFSRTKHGANKITRKLEEAGIKACAIHGNKSQAARTKALSDFKKNKVQIMVATDIAARGLDIDQLPQVVNFDLPQVPEDYVHRIGRTGRAGATGEAISLVAADEFDLLRDIERVLGKVIERDYVSGFEPNHDLPASPPPGAHRPRQAKKPNRAGGGSAGNAKPAAPQSRNSRPSRGRDAKPGGSRGQTPTGTGQRRSRPSSNGRSA